MKTRVVGYVRVSSEQQAEDGVSLDAQKARLRAYALAMDLELVAVDEDAGVSAKSIQSRPGLLRALSRLDAGDADGILVVKLDRLTRSVRDLGDLVERYFVARFSLLSVLAGVDLDRPVLKPPDGLVEDQAVLKRDRAEGAVAAPDEDDIRVGDQIPVRLVEVRDRVEDAGPRAMDRFDVDRHEGAAVLNLLRVADVETVGEPLEDSLGRLADRLEEADRHASHTAS
jgi:hypothetical protein